MSPAELERLYQAHADALFAFLLNLTRDEADARDALQDAFCRLAARPGLPSAVRDERGYLLRLAHHAAVDRIRGADARRRAADAWERSQTELFSPVADPDAAAFQEGLTAALGLLPPEQRAVVHLHLWEGLTFDEIAALTGSPANTAASRYRYGLEKLRGHLRPIYDEIRETMP